jgi:hypothetical protein
MIVLRCGKDALCLDELEIPGVCKELEIGSDEEESKEG